MVVNWPCIDQRTHVSDRAPSCGPARHSLFACLSHSTTNQLGYPSTQLHGRKQRGRVDDSGVSECLCVEEEDTVMRVDYDE